MAVRPHRTICRKSWNVFKRGEFSLVGVGRALLHDPNWVLKLRNGEPLPEYDETSLALLT
jgi:2,4-dienoyl-CoA reductase-like NADH-dependent reductase (Old Yellow Enzyme family)